MNTKQVALSIFSGVMMFSPLLGSVHASTVNCSSNTTTVVSSSSTNVLFASQTVISGNSTGGNGTWGNIGGGSIRTGRAWSVSNQSIRANNNDTFIGVNGGGTRNNCVVVNTCN